MNIYKHTITIYSNTEKLGVELTDDINSNNISWEHENTAVLSCEQTTKKMKIVEDK